MKLCDPRRSENTDYARLVRSVTSTTIQQDVPKARTTQRTWARPEEHREESDRDYLCNQHFYPAAAADEAHCARKNEDPNGFQGQPPLVAKPVGFVCRSSSAALDQGKLPSCTFGTFDTERTHPPQRILHDLVAALSAVLKTLHEVVRQNRPAERIQRARDNRQREVGVIRDGVALDAAKI